jgi:hypothetical protein
MVGGRASCHCCVAECVCVALLHYLIPFLLFLVLLRRYSLENDISNVLNKKAHSRGCAVLREAAQGQQHTHTHARGGRRKSYTSQRDPFRGAPELKLLSNPLDFLSAVLIFKFLISCSPIHNVRAAAPLYTAASGADRRRKSGAVAVAASIHG